VRQHDATEDGGLPISLGLGESVLWVIVSKLKYIGILYRRNFEKECISVCIETCYW
jgi:hypothetical protein